MPDELAEEELKHSQWLKEFKGKGLLVIKRLWPGMLLGVHSDPERYKKAYWSRFPGVYYTGDYAVKDKDGYFWILGRADEVIKSYQELKEEGAGEVRHYLRRFPGDCCPEFSTCRIVL